MRWYQTRQPWRPQPGVVQALLLGEGVAGVSSRACQQQPGPGECISHHECAVGSGFSRRLSMRNRDQL